MNDATLLLRQIHPNFIHNGRVTSQAFRPTPKDKRKLSVYDGDLMPPEQAHRHYTQELALASAGVMAVSVKECRDIDLQPAPDPEPFPEHAVIDFGDLPEKHIKTKSKILKSKATERGWLYQDA